MPVGYATLGEQTHRERRCRQHTNATLVEEVHEVYQLIVAQAVVAEVHNTFHHTRLGVLDDPFQILQLQVGNAHMLHDAFTLQLMQGRQRLVNHLLQTAFHTSLELDVVDVDNVDIVNVQALQALINALFGTLGRIVPRVNSIFAITSHLGREVELVARDVLEGLSQYGLCLVVSIVGRYVDDVDTCIDSRKNGVDATMFVERVEYPTQRRGAEAQLRHLHSCFT